MKKLLFERAAVYAVFLILLVFALVFCNSMNQKALISNEVAAEIQIQQQR